MTNPFAYAGNADPASSGSPDPELSQIAQAYTKHLTNTILAVKNVLDWMSGDDDMAALTALLANDPQFASH